MNAVGETNPPAAEAGPSTAGPSARPPLRVAGVAVLTIGSGIVRPRPKANFAMAVDARTSFGRNVRSVLPSKLAREGQTVVLVKARGKASEYPRGAEGTQW